MCQSFRTVFASGQNTAEIFYGRIVLDEKSIAQVYCPKCSDNIEKERRDRVSDNGWVLELDMEVVKTRAGIMEIPPDDVTADRVFDEGFATWVGITPDDFQKREQERAQIQKIAKIDLRAYIQAMKEWGLSRERRFMEEGWRKMKVNR